MASFPEAAKATLFGDRFGLDPFLSISEARPENQSWYESVLTLAQWLASSLYGMVLKKALQTSAEQSL